MVRRVFRPLPAEGYEWAFPVSDEDYEKIWAVGEEPVKSSWTPIAMKFLREDERRTLNDASDFPWLTGQSLVLRERAALLLEGHLRPYGELLPLKSEEGNLYAFHVCHVIDALDMEQSAIRFFRDGKIMNIESHEFRPESIGEALAFKITGFTRGGTFLTEAFVQLVEANQLNGVDFLLLWDEETGPAKLPLF